MFSRVLLIDKSPTTIGLKPAVDTIPETVSKASTSLPAMKESTWLPSITGDEKSAANVVLNAFTTFVLGNNFCNSSAALVSGEVTKPLYDSFRGFAILITIFVLATSLIFSAISFSAW